MFGGYSKTKRTIRQAGKTSQTSRFPENHRGGNSPSQRCHTKGIPAQLCSLRSSAVRDIPTLLPPWRGKEHSIGCHSGLRIQLWDDRTPREISFLHSDYITSQNWVVLLVLSLSELQFLICKIGIIRPILRAIMRDKWHIFVGGMVHLVGIQLFPSCPVLPIPCSQTSKEVLTSPVRWGLFHQFLAVWPWTHHLASLGLILLIF